MSKLSPMQMSLKHLRSQGYLCAIVEHWNPHAKVRKDLWGFDIICAGDSADCIVNFADNQVEQGWRGFLFIQTTTYGNVPAREKKLRGLPSTKRVLTAGGRIFVHGWDRNRFREIEVTL